MHYRWSEDFNLESTETKIELDLRRRNNHLRVIDDTIFTEKMNCGGMTTP